MMPDITATLVLEWENAEGLGLEPALLALTEFGLQIQRTKYAIARPVRLLIVTSDDHGLGQLKRKIDDHLIGFRDVMVPELLYAPATNYYGKKGIGLSNATSDIVVFGDADCRLSENWFDCLVEPLIRNDASLVSGFTVAEFGASWKEHASTLAWFFALDDKADPLYGKTQTRFGANNFAIRTVAGHKAPIPHSAGSRAVGSLWMRQLKSAGFKVEHAAGAKTFHKQYDSLTELMRRGWMLGADKDVANCLCGNGRSHRISRGFSSLFRLNVEFAARFWAVGFKHLPGWEWIPVFFTGIAFQTVAAISQIVHAAQGYKAEAMTDYKGLMASARFIA